MKADTRAWSEKTGNPIVSLEEQDGKIVVVVEIQKR